ncbi:hypothetical protein GA0115240_13665 [Streptomyces sp. DvalAA-14]|uniref:PspA-associated protein PspAB n=1 Tax=unclassified Streptomyces TaxID=2593676 RepID=UPI00081B1D0B|nr:MULTISPECIES: hypothetical protein [unclassified Streptomyces]MYS21925.1 hypothetical protein [Streptomyces sp. SID4948]SCE04564.1 hypothetical protein GA0115240_13665 [Streptomyces sp. DvalAA-14]
MGLLDVLLGRTKPVRPDLDQLFGLSSAAITLEAASELRPTGLGSVCFAAVEGGAFAEMRQDLDALLSVEATQDAYGYTWLLARHDPAAVTDLVTDLHAVNSALEEHGFGPQLLCSLVGFKDPAGRSLALVYLYKRGSFYPFAPLPGEKRDSALELQIKALVGNDLRLENDLSRWFPVWGAPGL